MTKRPPGGLVTATAPLVPEVRATPAQGVKVIVRALAVRRKVLAQSVVVNATVGRTDVPAPDISLEARVAPRSYMANA